RRAGARPAPGAARRPRRDGRPARLDHSRPRPARRDRRGGRPPRRAAARARRAARPRPPRRARAAPARARRAQPRGLPLRPRAVLAGACRRPPARGRARAADPPRVLLLLTPEPSMTRSPLVIAATVAGTAGVLAFHAQSPAVQTATATTT